jgi:cobalt/nickel transport system permease protein
MKLGVDQYAHLDSPLHRWEPRLKLVGLLVMVTAFSLVRDLRLLPAMLLVTALLYAISSIPPGFLWARLRTPGVFLLVLAVLLPFLSGPTVIYRWGPVALRKEGCLAFVLVVTKFVSILTTSLVLFGSAPFLTTIKAMRALRLPTILADMVLLSYRYIFEIGGDLARMETAMRLRGFRARRLSGRGLYAVASLVGSILVRSYERSERIYKAMILRGYGQAPRLEDEFEVRSGDVVAFAVVLLIGAAFIAAELVLREYGG